MQETRTKRAHATIVVQQRARAKEAVMIESQSTSIRSNDNVRVEDVNNDDNPTQHHDVHVVDTPTGRQQNASPALHADPRRKHFSIEMRVYM